MYNLQEKTLFGTTTTTNNYISSLSHNSRKYPFTFKNNLIPKGTLAADKIWPNISLVNHATEFNALIIAKTDSYRLSLMNLPWIIDKINKLLEILRGQNQ